MKPLFASGFVTIGPSNKAFKYTLDSILVNEMGWQYDPRRNTYISYTGCQAGLKTDGRCAILDCKFLCFISEQPDAEISVMKLLCPRENQIEPKESVAIISRES